MSYAPAGRLDAAVKTVSHLNPKDRLELLLFADRFCPTCGRIGSLAGNTWRCPDDEQTWTSRLKRRPR